MNSVGEECDGINHLERGGAGDDLDELSGDDGLPRPVVRQLELLDHLA